MCVVSTAEVRDRELRLGEPGKTGCLILYRKAIHVLALAALVVLLVVHSLIRLNSVYLSMIYFR